MKSKTTNLATIRKLAKVLDKYRTSAIDLGADTELLVAWSQLTKFLRNTSVHDFEVFVEERATQNSVPPKNREKRTFQFQNLAISEVENMLHNTDLSKEELVALAKQRFGLTSGEISSLRNIANIKIRIENLVENELTHQTIRTVAASK